MMQRRPIAALWTLASILIFTGCDGDGPSSPTAPTPAGPLLIQSDSTATQTEPGVSRVQVRYLVTSGLAELSQAAQSGTARGEVCLDGTCSEEPLTTSFAEGMCATVPTMPAGDTAMAIAAAWINGDTVGIDFCVEDLGSDRLFEVTVTTGANRSNTVQTLCTQGTCFSS